MRTIPFSVVGLCTIRTLLGLKNLPANPLFSFVVTDRSAQIALFLSNAVFLAAAPMAKVSEDRAAGRSEPAHRPDPGRRLVAGCWAYIKPRGFFKESERALSFGRNVPFR